MDLLKFSIKRVETALNTRCWDVVFDNDNARDRDREAIKRSSKNNQPEEPVEKCDGDVEKTRITEKWSMMQAISECFSMKTQGEKQKEQHTVTEKHVDHGHVNMEWTWGTFEKEDHEKPCAMKTGVNG